MVPDIQTMLTPKWKIITIKTTHAIRINRKYIMSAMLPHPGIKATNFIMHTCDCHLIGTHKIQHFLTPAPLKWNISKLTNEILRTDKKVHSLSVPCERIKSSYI